MHTNSQHTLNFVKLVTIKQLIGSPFFTSSLPQVHNNRLLHDNGKYTLGKN